MTSLATRLQIRARLAALKLAVKVIPAPRPLVMTGSGSATRLCQTMAHLGVERPLIVTDAMLAELGVIDPVVRKIKRLGGKPSLFTGVTPDPTHQVVEQGLATLRRDGCDAVLAIGGGSSIDAAKVIALAAGNDTGPGKLVGLFKGRKPALPLFVIPTTAGTGSEVTVAAVISDDRTHRKALVIDPKVVPLGAALDPMLMQGMPPRVTADTGIDALTHALEAWISDFANAETDRYAGAAVKLVLEYLPRAYHKGDDLQARDAMALASHYAGLAVNQAGVGYVHAIAHQLGAQYQVPHGRANAIVLPHILAFNRQSSAGRLAELARHCGLADAAGPDEEAADALISAVSRLLKEMQVEGQVAQLHPRDYRIIVKAALEEAHGTYPVPRYMEKRDVERILSAISP